MQFIYPSNGGQFIYPVLDDTGVVAAINVSYDNSGSGLSATNVQDAIDELATGSPGSFTIEYRTITSGEDSAKQLTLGATPMDPTKVILGVAGAPTQVYGTDFTVSGNMLSWNTTALDGILTAGDQLLIEYNV